MRLGVIDVGSNTVHLLVVDAHEGAPPLPAWSHKIELRLSEQIGPDGQVGDEGAEQLCTFIAECLEVAEDQGVEEILAFVTSAVREASNGDAVIAKVKERTGVDLQVLSGADEARLTFLAARRWFGWSSGRLLVLDIGGGSLEIAAGQDEEPDAALSLPLGAGRLTRNHFTSDPPKGKEVRALRSYIRTELGRAIRPVLKVGAPDRVVGTSKTMRSLGRLTGAAPSGEGIYVRRTLTCDDLPKTIDRLAGMPARERADLPGVSSGRSEQVLAGALVAQSAMELLKVDRLFLCPWALREGIILRWLDHYGS